MCVCKNLILKEFYDLNRLIELSFKYIFHNDIFPHFKFLLSTERLYFCDFFNKRSKGLKKKIKITAFFDHIYQGCRYVWQ